MGEKNDQNPVVKDDMVETVNDGFSYQILMNQLFAACHGNSRNHDCSCTGLTRPLSARETSKYPARAMHKDDMKKTIVEMLSER